MIVRSGLLSNEMHCRIYSMGLAFLCLASLAIRAPGQEAAGEAPATRNPLPQATSAPPYAPQDPVSGELNFVGSRTLGEIVGLWSRGFRRIHPEAQFKIQTQGSETALESIAADQSSFALFSRPPEAAELKQLEKQTGLTPVPLIVGKRVLAVFVHKKNPLEVISREGLKKVYQASEKKLTWSDLGASGDFAKQTVTPHSYKEKSGARKFLMDWAVGDEGQERETTEHSWHSDAVKAVAADESALGYASLAAVNNEVKLLAIQENKQSPAALPEEEEIASGRYPLVPALYVVVLRKENEPLPALQTELLRYIFSRSGQSDIVKDGLLPLTRPELNAQLDKLGGTNIR